MFLSRTVAAEICMEVKTNEAAYNALRRLDKDGMLKFELSCVCPLNFNVCNMTPVYSRSVVVTLIKVSARVV